jgi:hypothetical protein
METQLGVSHLHAPYQLLHVIGQGVEVVALTLEGEHRGLLGVGIHG